MVYRNVSLKSNAVRELNHNVFVFQDHFRADYELRIIKKKQRNEHKTPKVTLSLYIRRYLQTKLTSNLIGGMMFG